MRWYKRLIADKFNGSKRRKELGRPRVSEEVEQFVLRMAEENATWHGLVTYYVLVVINLSTRRVHIAGISPNPNEAFMMQCARQLSDHVDGFLLGKRYLIHDRDSKFTDAFDQLLRDSGVEPVVLPLCVSCLNDCASTEGD